MVQRIMKRCHHNSATPPFIRWEFERDHRHLMCAIHAMPAASLYEVATVPLWDVGRTAVETFNSPSAALQRHASIAADLRSTGWTVAAYTV
jgi:hypothetical protein